jgi:hypothetical protein
MHWRRGGLRLAAVLRAAVLGAAVGLGAGCASQEGAQRGQLPLEGPAGAAYSCARSEMLHMGYRLVGTDDAGVVLVAERVASTARMGAAERGYPVDQLAVQVQQEGGEGKAVALSVTPVTLSRRGVVAGSPVGEMPLTTTSRVRQDANRIEQRCNPA